MRFDKKDFLKLSNSKEQLDALFAHLEKKSPGEYEMRIGLNGEMIKTLSERTRLVIVGTAIPADLSFFYMGNKNYLYKWMDESIGTKLDSLKKSDDIEAIKATLKKLGVVFLDVANWCCNKIGDSSDKAIKGYVADENSFQLLKRFIDMDTGIKIVSVSINAQYAIENLFSIKSELIPLFAHGSKKQPWLDLFTETLEADRN